jgi:hypothetical protein
MKKKLPSLRYAKAAFSGAVFHSRQSHPKTMDVVRRTY